MLKKKRLLFIIPKYMGYWRELYFLLLDEYDVVLIFDIKKNINKAKKYLKQSFDMLFVIRGDILSHIEGDILKCNVDKKVLYEWDSLQNFNYYPYIYLFDSVKTFDIKDAREKNLTYLPLFYSKLNQKVPRTVDMLFIGVWHSDRYELLEKFKHILQSNSKKIYFKLYYKWYYYIPFVFIRKIPSFHFYTPRMVSQKRVKNLYLSSYAVLDLAHPNQTGYTMRTIESLGNGCKLITTNDFIKLAPFYNEKNIFVFDRNKEIDEKKLVTFLNTPYEKMPDIDKYEIRNWIKKVIE